MQRSTSKLVPIVTALLLCLFAFSARADADCAEPQFDWLANVELLDSDAEVIPYDLVIAPSGEIFVVGQFRGRVDFDPSETGVDIQESVIPGSFLPWNAMDLFVTRLEADGSYGWTYWDGFDLGDAALAAAIDPPDDVDPTTYIIVVGYFERFLVPGVVLGPSIGRDAFVAKFPIDGSFGFPPTAAWARSFSSNGVGACALGGATCNFDGAGYGGDAARSVAVDSADGSIYVGLNDGRLIKLNADGGDAGGLWPLQLDSNVAMNLTSDGAGGVVAVLASGAAARFDGDGNQLWSFAPSGVHVEAADLNPSDGSIFLTGDFTGVVDFNPGPGQDFHESAVRLSGDLRQPVFTKDAFLTRLNADGSYGWTWVVGGKETDRGLALSVNSSEETVVVAGVFDGVVNFDPAYWDVHVESSAGAADAFVTQLGTDGTYGWTVSARDGGGASAVGGDSAGNVTFSGTEGDFAIRLRCDFASDDLDGDGVTDALDDCPDRFDPDQIDSDGDGDADACDVDFDNDGVHDAPDNCPETANADQADLDLDGVGDVCDPCTPFVYWVDSNPASVRRSEGQCSESMAAAAQGLVNPQAIAVDVVDGLVYWADAGTPKIRRMRMGDGGVISDLIAGSLVLASPTSIALDLNGGKLYWADAQQAAFPSLRGIHRANLDGSAPELLVNASQARYPRGVALNLSAGKLYWTDSTDHKIRRANLDGTAVEDVLTGLTFPFGIAIDAAAGWVYWTDLSLHSVHRARLDGSDAETIVTNQPTPLAIALDLSSGKVYWSETSGDVIRRSNMDGSSVEVFASGVPNATGIAIASETPVELAGDCDGSGDVNAMDVPCFVSALLGVNTNPPGGVSRSDVNGDGAVDGRDIQSFVALLLP